MTYPVVHRHDVDQELDPVLGGQGENGLLPVVEAVGHDGQGEGQGHRGVLGLDTRQGLHQLGLSDTGE